MTKLVLSSVVLAVAAAICAWFWFVAAANAGNGWYITAYAPGCGDSGHGTARGHATHWGTIAVDPAVIPLGARVWVHRYGWGVADDTGPAVRGRHVDVWMPSCSQARRFTHYGSVIIGR